MQDLLWENRPTKGRRQVFDIGGGGGKILKIRHFERESGVLTNVFDLRLKLFTGFYMY